MTKRVGSSSSDRGGPDGGRREEIAKCAFDHVVDVAIAKKKNNFARPHDLRGPVDECVLTRFACKYGLSQFEHINPKIVV